MLRGIAKLLLFFSIECRRMQTTIKKYNWHAFFPVLWLSSFSFSFIPLHVLLLLPILVSFSSFLARLKAHVTTRSNCARQSRLKKVRVLVCQCVCMCIHSVSVSSVCVHVCVACQFLRTVASAQAFTRTTVRQLPIQSRHVCSCYNANTIRHWNQQGVPQELRVQVHPMRGRWRDRIHLRQGQRLGS